MLLLSLTWSTVVGLLGLQDQRPWNSFFLQYLWEFGLGMKMVEKVMRKEQSCSLSDIDDIKWWWLIVGAIGGMGTSAFMAWNGGMLQLYNDIPSLFGYLSVALLVYKIDVKYVNRFFEWANSFSYELYLLHMLVLAVIIHFVGSGTPLAFLLISSFVIAYLSSWGYKKIL